MTHTTSTSTTPVELVWIVAPEDDARFAAWRTCRDQWLNATERRSDRGHTRRAYDHDWQQFFAHFQADNLLPWQVTRRDVAAWVAALSAAHLSPATINRKLAALSSFFAYAIGEDLTAVNPCSGRKLRYRVSPYGRVSYPSTTDVAAILGQIDTSTVIGQRNLAVLGGMYVTTRRVSEWVELRWGDIHEGPDGYWFDYTYKGGSPRRQAIVPTLWREIENYLRMAGRLNRMTALDYVFVAHSAVASRLPHLTEYTPGTGHLSASYVNALLRRYGAAAGIPANRLHAHGLRHAGMRARQDDGADLLEQQRLAGHANIATTQIYIERALKIPVDSRGDRIIADVLPKKFRP